MHKLLYRADGGYLVGMGHIQRALRVLRRLGEVRPDLEFLLICRDNPATRKLVSENGVPNLSAHFLETAQLRIMPHLDVDAFHDLAAQYAADVLVVDTLDTSAGDMRRLRELAPVLVTFDDRGDGRLYCDLICSFLVRDPDPSKIDLNRTWLREGPEYATLGPEFVGVKRTRTEPERVGRVLVSLGGADAAGLAVKVAAGLATVPDLEEVDFTLGPAFQHQSELESIVAQAPWQANLHVNLPTLFPLYATADLAICAGGLTMHEAVCCGVPEIAVCQPIDHQLLVAEALEKAGCAINLGYGEELASGALASTVRELSADPQRRQAMSDAGPRVCDGRGAERVAELIVERSSLSF